MLIANGNKVVRMMNLLFHHPYDSSRSRKIQDKVITDSSVKMDGKLTYLYMPFLTFTGM